MENIEKTTPDIADTSSNPHALNLKGRFARYNSPFLELMIPILTTRYIWLSIEDINPFNFLKKPDPRTKADYTPFVKPNTLGYISRNFAALGMGATMLGVTGFYTKRTYDDIKTLYASAVGYELDKKPEDVNWRDIFFNSKNEALSVTRKAYVRRTIARMGAGSAFFFPWHMFRDFKFDKPKYDANANAGVGAMGLYLSLDGFVRRQTFFEAGQNNIDSKINHRDTHTHEIFKSEDIESMMLLQRKHLDKQYRWPTLNSEEGLNETLLASRIAELLNEAHNNIPKKEAGNFDWGKFIFLVGSGLLEEFPASLGFVELAHRSPDMKPVRAAAAAIKDGRPVQEVFLQAGIDLNAKLTKQADSVAITDSAVISPEASATKFINKVQPASERIPSEARLPQDFAVQNGGHALSTS